jgi:hypothetical protein
MRWRRKAWHRKCLGDASCIPKYLLCQQSYMEDRGGSLVTALNIDGIA